jgi:hypothetical protein
MIANCHSISHHMKTFISIEFQLGFDELDVAEIEGS